MRNDATFLSVASVFHESSLVRGKRSTHTRDRLRTATPWNLTTNASVPAAEAILSGSDENGGYANARNAPKIPEPRTSWRDLRGYDAHWNNWRSISNRLTRRERSHRLRNMHRSKRAKTETFLSRSSRPCVAGTLLNISDDENRFLKRNQSDRDAQEKQR